MKTYNGTVYHGSNYVFDRFDPAKPKLPNTLYGGGLAYLTDSRDIAKLYAKQMSSRVGFPIVYTATLHLKKVFDVSANYTGDELVKLLPSDVKSFASEAKLVSSSKPEDVAHFLSTGQVTLDGLTIFNGLSKNMTRSVEARHHLKTLGYDGLRYGAGTSSQNMKSSMFLIYDLSSVKLTAIDVLLFKK